MNTPLPAAGLKDLLLFFLGRRRLFQVEGNSMLPSFPPGQRLLVKMLPQSGKSPSPGSVVICRHPNDTNLVLTKRVWQSNGDWLELRGDNPEASTDSRQFGKVPLNSVIGVVTAVIASPGGRSERQ